MAQITRSWMAFAAIGAAVIHFALVIGSPPALGAVLAVLGAAEFAWGILTLSRDRIVVPRIARVGAIAPVIVWGLAVVLGSVLVTPIAGLNVVPMIVATLFELFIAIGISVQLREARPPATAAPGRYLVAMFAGALVVAAITTPALAFTQAGIAPSSGQFSDTGHSGH
jgi:hypothetical protein